MQVDFGTSPGHIRSIPDMGHNFRDDLTCRCGLHWLDHQHTPQPSPPGTKCKQNRDTTASSSRPGPRFPKRDARICEAYRNRESTRSLQKRFKLSKWSIERITRACREERDADIVTMWRAGASRLQIEDEMNVSPRMIERALRIAANAAGGE